MKKINFLKAMMMAVISISAMTFTSCSDDDDEPSNTLKLSSTKVEIAPNATSTVTIGSGTSPFTVNSSDVKIATADLKDKTITIKGVAEGNAIVKVTDKANQTGQIIVTVKTPLTVDKASAKVGIGNTVEVNVSNGTMPYTVSVKDTKIAKAKTTFIIDGNKHGSSTKSVCEKPLQLSASLSAGVKVTMANNASLFIEAGSSYYIDNHSSVDNVYKDKPLNFDFNIGVRINLNK